MLVFHFFWYFSGQSAGFKNKIRSWDQAIKVEQRQYYNTDSYSEPCQTSKMECFSSCKLLTNLAKRFILDAWHGSKYSSAIYISYSNH